MSKRCSHKPLLRWAGSKKRQFTTLSHYFPVSYERYIEPFAGSAAFLFQLAPKRAVINDINADLMAFYNEARKDPLKLYRAFIIIPGERQSYEAAREIFNQTSVSFQRSVLFYYLNRNCFNGIFRVNQSGNFNVPFSNSRVSRYLTENEFVASASILSDVILASADFEKFCLSTLSEGDFIFLDPPYYDSSRRIFNEYNSVSFTTSDLYRLNCLLRQISSKKAKFLLTLPRTPDCLRLAEAWSYSSLDVLRTIAGNPASRRRDMELVIRNYEQ